MQEKFQGAIAKAAETNTQGFTYTEQDLTVKGEWYCKYLQNDTFNFNINKFNTANEKEPNPAAQEKAETTTKKAGSTGICAMTSLIGAAILLVLFKNL